MQHGNRQPKNGVIRFPVRQQLIQGFRDVLQRDYPRIIHRCRQGRLQDVARIEPRQLLSFAVVVIRSHPGQRLQRSAKSPLRLLGRAGDALDLTLGPGEQRHQQVSLAQRISSQHDRFRLLQWHGISVNCRQLSILLAAIAMCKADPARDDGWTLGPRVYRTYKQTSETIPFSTWSLSAASHRLPFHNGLEILEKQVAWKGSLLHRPEGVWDERVIR